MIYSDHFTCVIKFEKLPKKETEKEEKVVMWNLTKENGWKNYKELLEKSSSKLLELVENEELSIEDIMKKMDAIQTKVKFQAFGKVALRERKEREDNNKKDKSTEDIANEILEEQTKNDIEEIKKNKKKKRNRVGRIWEIRKKIVGGKKGSRGASAIIDP